MFTSNTLLLNLNLSGTFLQEIQIQRKWDSLHHLVLQLPIPYNLCLAI